MTPEEQRTRALEALKAGRITQEEYAFFIASLGQNTPPAKVSRRTVLSASVFVVLLVFAAALFWGNGVGNLGNLRGVNVLSGLAVFEQQTDIPSGVALTQSSNMTLDINSTTLLAVTGTLANGRVRISLHSDQGRSLVYEADALAGYSVATDKESYALGEPVHITVEPSGVSYTLYLITPSDRTLIDGDFVATSPGDFTIDALINDSGTIAKASAGFVVRDDADPANDIPASGVRSISFTKECVETCIMEATSGALVLEVELSEGAQLQITNITASRQSENNAPAPAGNIPDLSLDQGETVQIELAGYFTDEDGDTLVYDYMGVQGVTMAVNGSTLSVTGAAAGSGQSMIYASDGATLVRSNLFAITVAGDPSNTDDPVQDTQGTEQNSTQANDTAVTENQDVQGDESLLGNQTPGDTPTAANESAANITQNVTEEAPAPDCTASDPNKRPAYCLYQDAGENFPDDEILLENLDRAPVARFTQIGNLLLKGRIIEHSTAAVGSRDFRIGYVDRDGNSVATIWIDTQTGDLHLLGTLSEENANLAPPSGSYSLMNKRLIFFAYADQHEGNLVVRGNVIPYKLR